MTNKDIAAKEVYDALKGIVTCIEKSSKAINCEAFSNMHEVCKIMSRTGQYYDAVKALQNFEVYNEKRTR